MSGPWEKFAQQAQPAKPWERFQNAPQGVDTLMPDTIGPPSYAHDGIDPAQAAYDNQTQMEPGELYQRAMNPQEAYSGAILPIRKDADGSVHFDSDAGLLGGLKRAFELPGQVLSGEVDPNSEEGMRRAFEMAGAVTPAGAAAKIGAAGRVSLAGGAQKPTSIIPPTAKQLKQAGGAAFDAMRASGATYEAKDITNLSLKLISKLNGKGLGDKTAKKTNAILKELLRPPKGSYSSIEDLHALRSTFGAIAGNTAKASDSKAASIAKATLDEFIDAAGKSDPSGKQAVAADALKRGNSDYAAGFRSDLVNGIEQQADLRAAAANSGQNIGNSTRQKVASALLAPKRVAGFSKDEISQLKGVVYGSKAANRTRDMGNMLGGGGGGLSTILAGAGGVGATALTGSPGVGLAAAALPIVAGRSLRGASNKLTKTALRKADENIRRRSALYDEMLRNAPMSQPGQGIDKALVRSLLLQQAMAEKEKQGR